MQWDKIELGAGPGLEDWAQVGEPDYARNARAECLAYIKAIKRVCGEPPDGAELTITSNPHDFGTFYEVAVRFDPDNSRAVEWAYHAEEYAPGTWADAGMEAPGLGRVNGR